MLRKLFLTSFINFIGARSSRQPSPRRLARPRAALADTEEGSHRLLRLLLAAISSSFFFALLAVARPMRHQTDYLLACAAQARYSAKASAIGAIDHEPRRISRALAHASTPARRRLTGRVIVRAASTRVALRR